MRVIQLHPAYNEPADVVRNLRYRPDGRGFVALVGEEGAGHLLCWWDLGRDAVAHLDAPEEDDELPDDAPDPAVGPDLELVARAAFDDTGAAVLRLTDTWAKPPESRLLAARAGGDEFTAAAFTPGGDGLLAAVRGPTGPPLILRWDLDLILEEGEEPADAELDPFELSDDVRVTSLACAPNGAVAVAGTDDGAVRVCDLQTGKERVHGGGGGPVRAVRFSPDGRRMLVRRGGAVEVWDAKAWRPLTELAAAGPLTDAAFGPNGRTLAAASTDGTVTFWDAETFREAGRFAWPVGGLYAVGFAPDGLTCAAGGERGRVVVWDVDQ